MACVGGFTCANMERESFSPYKLNEAYDKPLRKSEIDFRYERMSKRCRSKNFMLGLMFGMHLVNARRSNLATVC